MEFWTDLRIYMGVFIYFRIEREKSRNGMGWDEIPNWAEFSSVVGVYIPDYATLDHCYISIT